MCQHQQQQHTHLRDNLAQLLQLRDDENTECQYCSKGSSIIITSSGSIIIIITICTCA